MDSIVPENVHTIERIYNMKLVQAAETALLSL